MSEFVKKPLQAKLNQQNILSRVENLETSAGAKPSARAGNLASITPDAGDLSAGSYLVYDQTTGALRGYLTATPKPEYPGYYMVFLDSNGVFQWGVNADDGSATWGAGSGKLNQDGLIISDAGDGFELTDSTYKAHSFQSFVPNQNTVTSFYRNLVYALSSETSQITNGDFETGSFSSWTETDPLSKISVVAGAGANGGYAAYFQTSTDTASLTQPLASPATYGSVIKFKAKTTTPGSTVTIGSTAEAKVVTVYTDWRNFIVFSMTSSTDVLVQANGGTYIDDIEVFLIQSTVGNGELSYIEMDGNTTNIVTGNQVYISAGNGSTTDSNQITLGKTVSTFRFADFNVQGSTDTNLFFVDNSANAVGIGTSTPATLLQVEGNITQSTYAVRSVVRKAAVPDNAATGIFTITTANETGSNDSGGYSCLIKLNISTPDSVGSGATATKFGMYSFSRSMDGGGTGTNSTVNVITTGASAATIAGTRDVGTITVTVTETSEYVMTVNVQVDTTGTSATTSAVIADIELLYSTFTTPPIVAVA